MTLQYRRKENIIGEDDPNFGPLLVLLDLFIQRAVRASASPWGVGGCHPREFLKMCMQFGGI